MGLGMARSAVRAGHLVTGHTRGNPEHARLAAEGGRLNEDVSAVVADKDVVCVNVFDANQVADVLYQNGVLARLAPGTVLILHTTSPPHLAIGIARDAPAGVAVVDGAFSGSPQQAADGALTVMAGGDRDVFERVETVLSSYAAYLRHVGPLGAGMRLKLINNLLFGAHVALATDAFRLAEKTGIAADVLADVLSRSSGASAALGMLARHSRPATGSAGMRHYLDKDIASALAAAEEEGLDLGTLALVARSFR